MRSNRGITVVSLIATVLILIVLASMTAITSIDAYNQMQYESYKAELEELQKAVDEVAEEFKLYNINNDKSYNDFFGSRYDLYVEQIDLYSISYRFKNLYNKYESELSGGETYLFTPYQIDAILNVKGINEDFIINFSTRRVYNTLGHKDPNGGNNLIFRLPDSALTENYAKNEINSALTNANIYCPNKAQKTIIDGTTVYETTLRIHYNDSYLERYDIGKIEYVNNDNEKYREVSSFEQSLVGEERELRFVLYEVPQTSFMFKVYDTEGICKEIVLSQYDLQ